MVQSSVRFNIYIPEHNFSSFIKIVSLFIKINFKGIYRFCKYHLLHLYFSIYFNIFCIRLFARSDPNMV